MIDWSYLKYKKEPVWVITISDFRQRANIVYIHTTPSSSDI